MQDDQILETQSAENLQAESEQTETTVETAAQPAQPAPETDQARNFRQLKESRERADRERMRAERERDEALNYIKQIEARQSQQTIVPEDDELSINPDDLVEGKIVKKVYQQVKDLKKELNSYKQQSASDVAESRLKAMHPDADRVLSESNISAFREKYPEMANTIYTSTGDMYSKMVSAYTMIKNLGIHQEDLFQADRELAQKNAAKPRPLTSISPQQGDTPLSKANAFANGLTDDLRKQLHKEMMDAMKAR